MTTVVGLNVQEQLFSVKEGVPVPLSLHVSVPIISIQSVGQMVSNLMIFTYFTIEFLEFIFRYLIKLYILSFGCCLGVTYDNRCLALCRGMTVQCEGKCICSGDDPRACTWICPANFNPVCGADGE